MTPSPTEDQILAQFRGFLVAVLDDDVEVIAGQPNRVPEPSNPRFVVMQPPRYERLRTNVDSFTDVLFTGSIAVTVMTVTAVTRGPIRVDAFVFGVGVAVGTKVVEQVSGVPGGVGVYTVTGSQTIASETLAAGFKSIEQGTQVGIRLDFHAADGTSGDMAQVVSTLMRDEAGVDLFTGQNPDYGVVPLYADDPRQVPFMNAEQQVEWRWSVEAMLQANQVLSVPQQFADSASVEVISVDATYAP